MRMMSSFRAKGSSLVRLKSGIKETGHFYKMVSYFLLQGRGFPCFLQECLQAAFPGIGKIQPKLSGGQMQDEGNGFRGQILPLAYPC